MAELGPVVLATTNRGKLDDFEYLFRGLDLELVLPADRDLALEVEETETTFEGNALLKAHAYAKASGLAAMADDSGLAVDALGGAPGVYSARYAGPECDDHANNMKLVADLQGIEDRRAAFVCALALVLPDGNEIVTHGRCEGRVIDEERGSNGFGYDVIFYREDLGYTFGQATPEEKNARSHRAAAVRAMIEELRARRLVG